LLRNNGDVGQRVAWGVDDAELPAFPFERFTIDEGIVDAIKTDGEHEICGARATQRDRVTPVLLYRLRGQPFLGFLRRLDLDRLGKTMEPGGDAAVIVREKNALDLADALFCQIACSRRRIDQQSLVACD